MRAGVYNRGQRRNKPVNLGFENTNYEVLINIIKKWPSQLTELFYSDWDNSEISVNYLDEMQEIFSSYLEMSELSGYFTLIDEILRVINNMKILEHNSSGELDFTPEYAYTPECAYPPRVNEKHSISKFYDLSSICNKFSILILFIIGVIAIAMNIPKSQVEKSKIEEGSKIVDWENNIIEMRTKFPSQNENMWFSFRAGVKTTVTEKPVQPSVFLLLYNDKKTSSCLAHSVGKEATKLLSESAQEPIIIKGEDLKRNQTLIQDYGLFTETYKHDIEEKHVMIILDLQDIPAVLAQSFHILCDVENPLVRDAAFLFTLQIDGNEKQNPTAVAEKHLKLLWKDSLDVDIMDPLITRVTNAVLSINLETNLPC